MMDILYAVVICMVLLSFRVECALVRVDSPVIVKKGDEAVFTWHVIRESSDTENLAMNKIRCGFNEETYDTNNMIVSGDEGFFNIYEANLQSTGYDKRLTSSHEKDSSDFIKSYVLKLENVTYRDEAKFGCTYRFEMGDKLTRAETKHIQLQVEGAPEKCSRGLPDKIDPQLHSAPEFTVDICGNPKPDVDITFAGMPIDNFTERNGSRKIYQRMYTFRLPKLTEEMCGERLSYTAVNKHGRLEDNMIIELTVTPKQVRDVVGKVVHDRTSNETCIEYLRWKSADVGKCRSRYIVWIHGGSPPRRSFETDNIIELNTCYTTVQVPNITRIQIQAQAMVDRGGLGQLSNDAVLEYAVQDFKPTTVSLTPGGQGKSDGGSNLGVIVGAVIAGIILIIVIIGITCWVTRRRKGELTEMLNNDSQPVYSTVYVEPEYEDTANIGPKSTEPPKSDYDHPQPIPSVYEVPDRPSEQLLYADLGPTGARPAEHKPNQSGLYSEVKTDEQGFPAIGNESGEFPSDREKALPVHSKNLLRSDDVEMDTLVKKADASDDEEDNEYSSLRK